MSVEIHRLSHRFGDFALEDIELRLGIGEYWALLGPSGAGKSLLLETLVGAYQPDSGSIAVDGHEITDVPTEKRPFGLVFQTPGLFPHFSVEGNVAYGLVARRIPVEERRRRVDEVVRRLGITALIDRPVGALSGGEAQRVAIARAIVVRPRLLLLDEPLSTLDHNLRLELQTELRALHDELGTTTLHVTHSREEALAVATHCAIMMRGRVVQAGPIRQLFEQPVDAEVALFLGVV